MRFGFDVEDVLNLHKPACVLKKLKYRAYRFSQRGWNEKFGLRVLLQHAVIQLFLAPVGRGLHECHHQRVRLARFG